MQIEVVTAKFAHGNNGYYFSPNGNELKKGDKVFVETEKGKDIVTIVREKEEISADQLPEAIKNVLRLATEEEVKTALENDKKAEGYLDEIKALVKKHKLEMKIISVEGNYNLSKLTINFTAENRVDFRDLVKELAEKFKTRIELRQIGPRDAARVLGGLGPCGKVCCCNQGLDYTDHVSIKMAKNQGLSLNPNSISGLCGKLLCCLAYENPYYVEVMKLMPKINSFVKTSDGEGKVIFCDLIKKTVSVRFQTENSSEIKNYKLEEVRFKKENNQ